MKKIIACLDDSQHFNAICDLSSFLNNQTNCAVSLLHVAVPHQDVEAKTDLTGAIGLGEKDEVLEELTDLDENHGKLERQKGQKILSKATDKLAKNNIRNVEILHRRGSLEEFILGLEDKTDLFVIGRNGEDSENEDENSKNLGANLQDIIHYVKKPLLVATKNPKPIKKFLIAYDGSKNSAKALEFVAKNSLFKNLEGHLLKVADIDVKNTKSLKEAEELLQKSDINITTFLKDENDVEEAIANHIDENNIDLLVIGSHGHSKIRSFILGSTTNHLINKSNAPILLIRS